MRLKRRALLIESLSALQSNLQSRGVGCFRREVPPGAHSNRIQVSESNLLSVECSPDTPSSAPANPNRNRAGSPPAVAYPGRSDPTKSGPPPAPEFFPAALWRADSRVEESRLIGY